MSANDELQAHTCEKMLEFYGNVANNVAQGNLQDNVKKSHITTENKPKSEKNTQDVQKKCLSLTEQWKKGELERGRYYIKYRGNYMQDNWHGDCWEDSWSEYVEEVLAPVPSYEEHQQLIKFLEEFNALDVAEENKKLKKLLKEVRDAWVIYKPYDRNQLCKRIDNAIGEKNNGN